MGSVFIPITVSYLKGFTTSRVASHFKKTDSVILLDKLFLPLFTFQRRKSFITGQVEDVTEDEMKQLMMPLQQRLVDFLKDKDFQWETEGPIFYGSLINYASPFV